MYEKYSSSRVSSAKVAVVVPFYRPFMEIEEQLSWKNQQQHLNKFPKIALTPDGLEPPPLNNLSSKKFRQEYFISRSSYSALLLSDEFYYALAAYEYILVVQLDCLVFADRLEEFCALGYDYIGAPFFKSDADPHQGFSRVGNGGFSLRKVSSFLRVLESVRIPPWTAALTEPFLDLEVERTSNPQIASRGLAMTPATLKGEGGSKFVPSRLRKRSQIIREARRGVKWYTQHYSLNEDLFWSDRARLFDPTFKVAPVEVGLKFAFERFPRYCYEQNGSQLPFGAHAWAKHDREFWDPFLNL